MKRLDGFARFAWFNVVYNLGVILWGAYVRATGSGAGCGDHWPVCNGQVIPREPTIQTLIEFTHRITSGMSLVFVIALVIFAWKRRAPGDPARSAAVTSVVLMIVEALLGAGLVLFRLVEDNASFFRAVAMALHLINTLFLVAALVFTAHFASGGRRLAARGWVGGILAVAWLGTLALGASGALAALGSTLFPEVSGLEAHLDPAAHFVLKLAVIHPMLALLVGGWLIAAAGIVAVVRRPRRVRGWAAALALLVLVQIAAGFLNIFLMAPIWLQLVHLLLADLVWIALVLLSAEALAVEEGAVEAELPVGLVGA